MSRERVVYERVYRVERSSTGISSNPDEKDVDTPAEAGRLVEEYLVDANTHDWHRITVRRVEVRSNSA